MADTWTARTSGTNGEEFQFIVELRDGPTEPDAFRLTRGDESIMTLITRLDEDGRGRAEAQFHPYMTTGSQVTLHIAEDGKTWWVGDPESIDFQIGQSLPLQQLAEEDAALGDACDECKKKCGLQWLACMGQCLLGGGVVCVVTCTIQGEICTRECPCPKP